MIGLFMAAAQLPRPLADLPFRHAQGKVLLKAHLNGRSIEAILDTGAQVSVADAAVSFAAGAKLGRHAMSSVVGAHVAQRRTTNLRLTLDGLKTTQNVIYAEPLKWIEEDSGTRVGALLGNDFLRRFAFEIDYPRSRVRFFDPKTYVPDPDGYVLPIRFVAGDPAVTMSMAFPGGKTRAARAIVDTGASYAVLTGSFRLRARLSPSFFQGPALSVNGNPGASMRVVSGIRASLGEIDFDPSGQWLMDVSKRGATGPRSPFDALLGADLFSTLIVGFDYGRNRIILKHPTS